MMRKIASILIGFVLTTLFVVSCNQPSISLSKDSLVAIAQVKGTPDTNLTGSVTLTQNQTAAFLPTVEVRANLQGLPPNTQHGFHIHQTGKCEPDFGAAGGHFDPGPYGQTDADANHPFHMGDLPNLVADESGNALLTYNTSRVSLSPGPLSLFDEDGSAIIVHINEDQGTTGVKGGAGGGRLGCGVIQKQA